jgi:putative PIN family toxin of toxin-antitoxin system
VPEKKCPFVVADTNVLVSALIGKRLRTFFETLAENKFRLCFSEQTFEELFIVLSRPKFSPYLSQSDIQEFKELMYYHSKLVFPKETIHKCRDPKDNIFLECAVEKPVDYVVTGDSDLLVLHPFRGIPIITPEEFFKILQQV